MNEKIKANPFLNSVIFLPKYFISTGMVTIPTIIRDEINAAICMYPAPFSNNNAAVGNAIKPGIKVTAPTKDAIITPKAAGFFTDNKTKLSQGLNRLSNITDKQYDKPKIGA